MRDEHKDAEWFAIDIDKVGDVGEELGIKNVPVITAFSEGTRLDDVGADVPAFKHMVKQILS